MGQNIKRLNFRDGSYAEFAQGGFDGWCVYYTSAEGITAAPKDQDYFSWLLELAGRHGADRVYNDFVRIYDQTGKTAEEAVLDEIARIASGYGEDSQLAEITFAILYMTMIAEENRAYTRLGRRIKRLGVYELLMGGRSAEDAATFMTGKGWREIAALCEARGF